MNDLFDEMIRDLIDESISKSDPVIISNLPDRIILVAVKYCFSAYKTCPVRNEGKPHDFAYGTMQGSPIISVMEPGNSVCIAGNSITLTNIAAMGCNIKLNGVDRQLVWKQYITFPLNDCTDVFNGIDLLAEPLYEKPLSPQYSCDIIFNAYKYNLNDPDKARTYLPEKIYSNVNAGDKLKASWGIEVIVIPLENRIILRGCGFGEMQWDDTLAVKGTPYSAAVKCFVEVTARKHLKT